MENQQKCRVYLVDNHPISRRGLRAMISDAEDIEVCGESHETTDALAQIESLRPDVVLCDLALTGKGTNLGRIDFIRTARARVPDLRILVIARSNHLFAAERNLRAGATGYLTKGEDSATLLDAIRKVCNGEYYLSQADFALMVRWLNTDDNAGPSSVSVLTDRETQVFQLLGMGCSTRDISTRLSVSTKTIETHRENIKKKLGLSSSVELIVCAAQWMFDNRSEVRTGANEQIDRIGEHAAD